ncbi:phosphoadenosine phosphosulfate reductase [uncultured Roseobacter sp.]|uniref:phosphoadenosine phosphosulfate reductase n=1 Tax=uncultured Roseobacter sp. TaxID=114847 RepID=UPI0026066D9A|nr:phosphoadenosine phosphosulfate reductase [uncultured Roseobacter sp.]
MPDAAISFEHSLGNMTRQEWISEVTDLVDDHGYLTPLGRKHIATFVEDGTTLLVTFETHQGIQTLSEQAHPLGWDMVKRAGWSHLGVISNGDTWFRDPAVYAFFDRLVDDGFFDEFDTVLFYGAGPCGYAAAAYSVAAPGAKVLAIQPQATLDPRVTEWDKRFTEMRRVNFADRYGYAPDMLDAASETLIIFDPTETEDAMHAALFTKAGVTKLPMRNMGRILQTSLLQMDVLHALILATGEGDLTPGRFAKLMRARRDHLPYLRRLLAKLDQQGRHTLVHALCRNVAERLQAPRFIKRLQQLTEAEDG